MELIELILISISLAMDAFAVAVCKGLSMKKMCWKNASIIGLYFGIFQALMPVIGYFVGGTFDHIITKITHFLSFVLLSFIGGMMIKESFQTETDNCNDDISFRTMIALALATSIDALAVGLTFSFLDVNILLSVTLVGVITFVIATFGVKIGNKFGSKYENKAQLTGGVILILMGIKILTEHL